MDPMLKMFDSMTLEREQDNEPEICGWICARFPTIYQNQVGIWCTLPKNQTATKVEQKIVLPRDLVLQAIEE